MSSSDRQTIGMQQRAGENESGSDPVAEAERLLAHLNFAGSQANTDDSIVRAASGEFGAAVSPPESDAAIDVPSSHSAAYDPPPQSASAVAAAEESHRSPHTSASANGTNAPPLQPADRGDTTLELDAAGSAANRAPEMPYTPSPMPGKGNMQQTASPLVPDTKHEPKKTSEPSTTPQQVRAIALATGTMRTAHGISGACTASRA